MKERPILFSAPMVRALLAGTKTQTRRALNPQPELVNDATGNALAMYWKWQGRKMADLGRDAVMRMCPYGQPGDRLWVRETFGFSGSGYIPDIHFRATNPEAPILGRWHPSFHMRRIDSRITLEITSVRVERLQEISEVDAQAGGWTRRPEVSTDPQVHKEAARDWFMDLWESINGPGSWDANPWVWVIEFRRLA